MPSRSRIALAGVAVMIASALYRLHTGEYSEAATNVILAGFMYIVDSTRRTYWLRGYAAAAESVDEQAGGSDGRQ